jgi:hypothetical protein
VEAAGPATTTTMGVGRALYRVDPESLAITKVADFGWSNGVDQMTDIAIDKDGAGANDRLVKLAAQTFAASAVGTDIGYADIWGLGFWKDKLFGFTQDGQFVLIDPTTGEGTLVASNGPRWWGAGVTTSAPVVIF